MQDCEYFVVETRADLAAKEQLFLFVVTNEHRAKVLPRAGWRSVTADDELLFIRALEFDPRAAPSSRLINRVRQLADDPLKTPPLDLVEERGCVVAQFAGVTNWVAHRGAKLPQDFFATA